MKIRHPHHVVSTPRALTAAAATLLATTLLTPIANAKSNIEGTWKISNPQTLFTPANHESIPFTAEGKKTYEANLALTRKGDFSFDATMSRCSSPGMPRIMLVPNQFKLFDRPGKVLLMFEWNRLHRQIDTRDDATIEASKMIPVPGAAMPMMGGFPGGGPSGPGGAGGASGPGGPGGPGAGAPGGSRYAEEVATGSQIGHSRGHWEGDTLVVETGNLSDFKLLDGLIQNSDELKLVERIRLKDKNTLEDRITISDVGTFTKPWETVVNYKRQPDSALAEDVCLERLKKGKNIWPK